MTLTFHDSTLNSQISIKSYAIDSILNPNKIIISFNGKCLEYDHQRFCSTIAEVLSSEETLPKNSLRVKLIKAIANAEQIPGHSAKRLDLKLDITKSDISQGNNIGVTLPEGLKITENIFVVMVNYIIINTNLTKSDPRLKLQEFCKSITFEELPDNKVKIKLPNKLSNVILPGRKDTIARLQDIHTIAPLSRMLGVTILLPHSRITFNKGVITLDKSLNYDNKMLWQDYAELFKLCFFKNLNNLQEILRIIGTSEVAAEPGTYEVNLNSLQTNESNTAKQRQLLKEKLLLPTNQADGILISLVISLFNFINPENIHDPANLLNNEISFIGTENTKPVYIRMTSSGVSMTLKPSQTQFSLSASKIL